MPCQTSAAEVGLLYALEEDWKSFAFKAGGSPQVRTSGQRQIFVLQAGPHRVRAVKMGSGNVETAVSVTALLATGRCDWVISLGPCGGLAPELTPGRLVLATRMAAWQASPGGPVVPLPFPAPLAPLLPEVVDQPGTFTFSAGGKGADLQWAGVRVASGERFVEAAEDRAAASAVGQVVEMNLAGAVGALNNYNVPGLHLRVISDRADADAKQNFAAFLTSYDGKLGSMAYDLILASKPDPTAPTTYPTLRELVQPRVPPVEPPATPQK